MQVVSLLRCLRCSWRRFSNFSVLQDWVFSFLPQKSPHWDLREHSTCPKVLLHFEAIFENFIHIYDHLEVLDCPDPELEGGVLVAHHQGVVVHLEGGDSPHVTHALLHRLVQRDGLVGPGDEHHHLPDSHFVILRHNDCHSLPCVHHSAHPHCESLFGHSVDVASKEPISFSNVKIVTVSSWAPGIGDDGVLGQGLHSGPRHQGAPRLIEGDVTVRPNAYTS